MKYQIVINLTKYISIKSFEQFNNIFQKYTINDKITDNEQDILTKIKSYAIIILVENTKTIENINYIGKYIQISSQEELISYENIYCDILPYDEIINPNGYCCVNISGGLGNQLFMLISIFAFANKNNRKFAICCSKGNPHSKKRYDNTLFKNFIFKYIKCNKKYNETKNGNNTQHFIYTKLPIFDKNDNCLYIGYFQNEKYLENIKYDILNLLNFKNINKNKIQNIIQHANNSCFIHVRLGDFCSEQYAKYHNILNKKYYDDCMIKINEEYINTNFIVLSDEPNKIEKTITLNNNIKLIDNNLNEIETLIFMINCNYGGIISNSTYSWWGGYLNNILNKTKIYIPNKFANIQENITINFDGCVIIPISIDVNS